MSDADRETLKAIISQAVYGTTPTSREELREKIRSLNDLFTGGRVSDIDVEHIAKEIEHQYSVTMGIASVVDEENFVEWLDDVKKNIDPFYWNRYRQLLIREGLPQDVVSKLDQVTDQILGRLGNPFDLEHEWDRRGMVVGHVQSGKTSNYSGLICKAADAGYRLIIVIAGIHNNLRDQTQERIDEAFIGRDTRKTAMINARSAPVIGVGHYMDDRVPVSLTTADEDFKVSTATTNKSQISSFNVPVVLVIKKNYRTLGNLIDWLRSNSARGEDNMIDQPMLLIDDEADNASINTKYQKDEVTKINGQIRDLLKVFRRSCYVGYTATPFANIFIDPDNEDDMFGEDLFPKHFIIGLEAPTNYFGGMKVFVETVDEDGTSAKHLRFIDDNEDLIPLTHKKDLDIDGLPSSLRDAIRAFLLTKTIRSLRGQKDKHASMLVNASTFTRVQNILRNRIHDEVNVIIDSLRISGKIDNIADQDPCIGELKRVFDQEFSGLEYNWKTVLDAMYDAIASAKVVEVNSSANDLDYSQNAQTVIAVGGYSLSRGLTLEGLSTTWFLRNTKMYDTLMQMGRWFGYRHGFEDLCRIWMPRDAVRWYTHIAEATDELHFELKRMQKARLTPEQFGLAVRSHPSSLMVTARNKLGSGQRTVQVGLSSQFVETARLETSPKSIANNRDTVARLLSDVKVRIDEPFNVNDGYLFKDVSYDVIDKFFRDWVNSDYSIQTQTGPIREYVKTRSTDELEKWDILFASNKRENSDQIMLENLKINPMQRGVLAKDFSSGFMSVGGTKMRVSSRGVEKNGISLELCERVEAEYRKSKNIEKPNYPGWIYRPVREKPLLIIYNLVLHLIDKNVSHPPEFPEQPVNAFAISFPRSSNPDERVEYIINTVKQRELFGVDEEDEELIAHE